MEHTPLPWVAFHNRIYMGAAIEVREIAVAVKSDPTIRHLADANAAFIAHACNCHKELVAACRAARDLGTLAQTHTPDEVGIMLDVALTRASSLEKE